jgi:hypothetical protein
MSSSKFPGPRPFQILLMKIGRFGILFTAFQPQLGFERRGKKLSRRLFFAGKIWDGFAPRNLDESVDGPRL